MTLPRMIRSMGVALIVVASVPLYLSEAMPAIFWMMATAGLLMGMTIGSKTFSQNILRKWIWILRKLRSGNTPKISGALGCTL